MDRVLIYRRMTGRAIWVIVPLVLVPVWAAALGDGNPQMGVVVSLVALVVLAATLWIGIGWAGRSRLAQVWRAGDTLWLQQGDLFDRGRTFAVPVAETTDWTTGRERYGRRTLDVVSFTHGERHYVLQVAGADHVNEKALMQLLDEKGAGAVPTPSAFRRDL